MIYKSEHEITAIRRGNRVISAVYRGARLLWQAVRHLSAWFRSEGWHRSEPW